MTTDNKKYSTYDDFMKCINDTLGPRRVKLVVRMPGTTEPTYTKEDLDAMREGVERQRKEREAMKKTLGLDGSKIAHKQIGGETYQEIKPSKMTQIESAGGRIAFTNKPV